MSQAFEYAEEQSGILGEEIAGEQGPRQVCQPRVAEDGLGGCPRVGTRVEVRGEGGGEGEKGVERGEGCIIGAEVYHDYF